MNPRGAELLEHFVDLIVPFVVGGPIGGDPATLRAGLDPGDSWHDRCLGILLKKTMNCAEWLRAPEEEPPGDAGSYALWGTGNLSPSRDLIPFVGAALGATNEHAAADPIAGRCVQLTDQGLSFIRGHLGGLATGWELKLRRDACRRLGAAPEADVRLHLLPQLAYVFWFPSGIGLLVPKQACYATT